MKTILIILLASATSNASSICTREWALDGQMKSKNYVYGLGLSNSPDKVTAEAEAKQNAFKDIANQLQSNVSTQSTLTETDENSSYAGKIDVNSALKELTGIKNIKDGQDLTQKITHCSVVKFDAGSAYTEYEGKMNVLEKSLEEISKAAIQKKYLDVLKKRTQAKKTIASELENIKRADLLRTYLKSDDQSWFEKIKMKEVEMDQVAERAKEQIVFVIPDNNGYEGAMAEIESRLSGIGFNVLKTVQADKPVNLQFELKSIGAPRKSKTALGLTLSSKIMISLKDGTRVISTNKGAFVTGTGPTEDDAIANIDRQLLVHLIGVINDGLPGLISEEE